jgi:hypothetical protein
VGGILEGAVITAANARRALELCDERANLHEIDAQHAIRHTSDWLPIRFVHFQGDLCVILEREIAAQIAKIDAELEELGVTPEPR